VIHQDIPEAKNIDIREERKLLSRFDWYWLVTSLMKNATQSTPGLSGIQLSSSSN